MLICQRGIFGAVGNKPQLRHITVLRGTVPMLDARLHDDIVACM